MELLVGYEVVQEGLKLLLLGSLLVQSYIDLRWQLLLDEVNLGIALLGVFYGYCFVGWQESALGAVLFGGLLLLLYYGAKGGLGLGDVKLGAALGFWLGLYGSWCCMLLALILGMFIALLGCGAGLLHRKSLLPFGPFLAISALLLLYQSETIVFLMHKLLEG